MIEVGDMILYIDTKVDYNTDIGWVVHTEKHTRINGYVRRIYIKWLFEESEDSMWEDSIEEYKEFILVKGGQHAE
tara:strand:+ start:59 stop:283 length:225 start_codon:yes stop_codon:yes gene_type:complete